MRPPRHAIGSPPIPVYSTRTTLLGLAMVATAVVAMLLAATYPGAALAAAAIAVARRPIRLAGRAVRRRRERTRQICVPGTDACVET